MPSSSSSSASKKRSTGAVPKTKPIANTPTTQSQQHDLDAQLAADASSSNNSDSGDSNISLFLKLLPNMSTTRGGGQYHHHHSHPPAPPSQTAAYGRPTAGGDTSERLINSICLETVHSPSELNDPRPQSVLSIHSSASNPDCTNGGCPDTPHPAAAGSASNGEHFPAIDETDDVAEEMVLQNKLKDLRTKKEEMLNLVKELQSMNVQSDARNQSPDTTSPRSVPVQFERIVPIELVQPARNASKSSSNSPASTTRTLTPVLTHKPHHEQPSDARDAPGAARPPTAGGSPRQKEIIARMDDQVLNAKLTEINALKLKLNRLQDMMKTVSNIEKQNSSAGQTPQPVADSSSLLLAHQQQYQALAAAVQDNELALNGTETDSEVDASVADDDDDDLENRVKSIHSMTEDLRLQSMTLAAERDRLKGIKNEISRRNELKENVLADLEEHVDRQIRQSKQQLGERRSSHNYEAPVEQTAHDKVCVNDISGDGKPTAAFRKNRSEEPWRRPAETNGVLRRHANNVDLHRETMQKLNFPSLVTSDKFATIDANGDAGGAASGDDSLASEGSRGGYMPPPMRNMGAIDSSWRKNSNDIPRFSSLHPTASSVDDQPETGGGGGYRPLAYGQCNNPAHTLEYPASPHCHHHAGGAPSTGNTQTCFNSSDPMLLQQFIQTQQMLINSVSQCNQLLWEQQRDINNLNSAVILLQERIINFANTRANTVEVPTVRAESVPPHSTYGNHPSYATRAQSEHATCYQQQQQQPSPAYPNYASSTSNLHQPQPSPVYRQYPSSTSTSAAAAYPSSRQFQPNNAFQANSINNARCSSQFPLPPPREPYRDDPPTIHHHLITLPVTPNSYLNNNPNSPLLNAAQHSAPPSHAHPMFAYHNNNHHPTIANPIHANAGPNAANNASAAAHSNTANNLNNHSSSNHTLAANINALPPLPNLVAVATALASPPPPPGPNHSNNNCSNIVNGGGQPPTLNNQVPPGNRANNYWDNFRSYSRQNLLSNNICKSNENVCIQQQQQQQQPHQQHHSSASHLTHPGRSFGSSSATHATHNILPVMDNKYFMHFRNQIHQRTGDDTAAAAADEPELQANPSHPPNYARYHGRLSDHRQQQPPDVDTMDQWINQIHLVLNEQKNAASNRTNNGLDQRGSTAAAAAGAEGYNFDLNLASSMHHHRPNTKPADKLFDTLKDDVYQEVSTLIAANESRPQFLINLFRELQLISTTDPLRDSLMQAFHELYTRYYASSHFADDATSSYAQGTAAPNIAPPDAVPQRLNQQLSKHNGYTPIERNPTQFSNEFVDKVLLRSIMIEVATFLLDLERITEPALQRIATIVLRQLNAGATASAASARVSSVQHNITHDELVRNVRKLDHHDPDLFLEQLKRLLVDMLSVPPSPAQRTINVSDERFQRRQLADGGPREIVDDAAGASVAHGVDARAVDQQMIDGNEDLAEADQMCGLLEDSSGLATTTDAAATLENHFDDSFRPCQSTEDDADAANTTSKHP